MRLVATSLLKPQKGRFRSMAQHHQAAHRGKALATLTIMLLAPVVMAPEWPGCPDCLTVEGLTVGKGLLTIELSNSDTRKCGGFYVDLFLDQPQLPSCGELSKHYRWVDEISAGGSLALSFDVSDSSAIRWVDVIVDSTELVTTCKQGEKTTSFLLY